MSPTKTADDALEDARQLSIDMMNYLIEHHGSTMPFATATTGVGMLLASMMRWLSKDDPKQLAGMLDAFKSAAETSEFASMVH